MEQAGRDQWSLLEQVDVEGVVEEQVAEGAAVVQVGWAAAGEQADLEAG